MKHLCHAKGCATPVPPRMLMCKPHWHMLPKPAQRVVWREYRAGQEHDKKPSARYLVAQSVAVMMVALKDGLMRVESGVDYLRDRWLSLPIYLEEAEAIYREMLA